MAKHGRKYTTAQKIEYKKTKKNAQKKTPASVTIINPARILLVGDSNASVFLPGIKDTQWAKKNMCVRKLSETLFIDKHEHLF